LPPPRAGATFRSPGVTVAGPWSLAAIYDAEHRWLEEDVGFFLARLEERRVRGPVLELGCGTGRVAVPLALAGYRVTGLDLSEAMLRRARRRRAGLPPPVALRLRFSRQDMRRFRLRGRFAAILAALSSFALLPRAEDRRACLERIAAHLAPGGIVLLDLPNPEAPPPPGGRRHGRRTFLLPPWGYLAEKRIEERWDARGRLVDVRYRYVIRRLSGGAPLRRMEMRFPLARVTLQELEPLLWELGCDVEAVWGDWRGNPWTPASPRMIVEAERLP